MRAGPTAGGHPLVCRVLQGQLEGGDGGAGTCRAEAAPVRAPRGAAALHCAQMFTWLPQQETVARGSRAQLCLAPQDETESGEEDAEEAAPPARATPPLRNSRQRAGTSAKAAASAQKATARAVRGGRATGAENVAPT